MAWDAGDGIDSRCGGSRKAALDSAAGGKLALPVKQCERMSFEERYAVWKKMLFTAICVTVPVAWGIFVNWVFDRIRNRHRNNSRTADEPVFHDYQI